MEALAYDHLGLLPWDLARLTPAELARQGLAWRRRDERTCQRLAWALTYIVNASGMLKQKIRMHQLLGELIGEARLEQLLREEAARDAARDAARREGG